jgi:hypothetical protein
VQGVVRPGLLSLRERYRLRGRELAEDGLVLREQLDAAREANGERLEELAALKRQVGGGGACCGHASFAAWAWSLLQHRGYGKRSSREHASGACCVIAVLGMYA